MNRRSLSLVALVLAAGIALDAAPIGDRPAPAVRLAGADGQAVSLSDLRGKVVLVDFWASWCAPCRRSFPELNQLQDLFGSRGLQVVAINLDEQRKDADAFLAAQRPPTVTVVYDPRGASAKAFGVQAMPSSFLIGRDGTIRFTHSGFNDDVAAQYRREIGQLLDEQAGGAAR